MSFHWLSNFSSNSDITTLMQQKVLNSVQVSVSSTICVKHEQVLVVKYKSDIEEANKIKYSRDVKETIVMSIACYKWQRIYDYQ